MDANLNALWSRLIVEELARAGVSIAVVCPGSRSTPLALACAAKLETFSVIDERSAAFFALGVGKATGKPAVVVATSGTAGAHFLPAAIEAAEARVPLVLLTADRPPELHGWGAPQTIDQRTLYGAFATTFDLGTPEPSRAVLTHLRATVARAVANTLHPRRGPVHLNAPFREPLAPVADGLSLEGLDPAAAPRFSAPAVLVDRGRVAGLRERLEKTSRGVIVCGPRDADDGFGQAVAALGRRWGLPVFAEAASNARFVDSSGVVALYDSLLRHAPFAKHHRPELILRFGGGITPKNLQAWIDASGAHVIQVSDGGALHDPQHVAAEILEGDAVELCRALERGTPRPTELGESFLAAERVARRELEGALSEGVLSEPAIATAIAGAMPVGSNLFVSSSMPIRDVDTFAVRSGARVLANRGVNGIDGVISTALGVAAGTRNPTVALVGDLAFLHDVGALVTAKRASVPLTVVVVNNDGGGIFSFLPIAQHRERFEQLFGTPHGATLSHAASLGGARYSLISSVEALRGEIARSLEGGLHVIEAKTDRAENVVIHRQLFERIGRALGDGPWR